MAYEWEMQRIEPIWLLDLTWLIDIMGLVIFDSHTDILKKSA